MKAPHFVQAALADAEYQLTKVFEGLEGDHWNFKVTSKAMSPHEAAIHLAEVYTAFESESRGEKWNWGGDFSTGIEGGPENLAYAMSLRSKVTSMVLESDSEAVWGMALGFLHAHDCYHVGQMILIRMELDDNFDPYVIYNH